jgi:FHS family Na+ dependent glucose MFS transporter 1
VRRPTPLYLASFLVIGMSLTMLGPALTELRERTGSTIGAIGSLFAAQSLGYIVGSFAGGRMLDRFDGHRVYSIAMALLAASLFSIALADSLVLLLAVVTLIGLGSAVVDVGANTMIIWHLGAGVGRSMNLLHLCFGIGALFTPVLVGIGVVTATSIAGVGAAFITLWALTVPAPRRSIVRREDQSTATRAVLMISASFFLLYVGLELGFAGWVHTYAGELDFSARAATGVTTAFWVSFTAGRLISAAVAKYVRPKMVLFAASWAAVAVAIVLVLANGAVPWVWVGAAMMGLATAPQFPVMLAYLERRVHLSGADTSWFVGAAGVGGLMFPFLIGQFIEVAGAAALPWAALVLAVATLASFIRINAMFGG